MVLKQELQRHQRQMAALSVSAEPAASQCPTALSLLGSVLEERHVQTHPMCSTATRCSARCYYYSPTGDGKTDSGKLKLVPFEGATDAPNGQTHLTTSGDASDASCAGFQRRRLAPPNRWCLRRPTRPVAEWPLSGKLGCGHPRGMPLVPAADERARRPLTSYQKGTGFWLTQRTRRNFPGSKYV